MWIDLTNGKLALGEELIVDCLFSFDQFMKTRFYNGQNAERIIKIEQPILIDEEEFIVELGFTNGIIRFVLLVIADYSIPIEQEKKRKEIHDSFLRKYGIDSSSEYEWGSIHSDYDRRGNISSINVLYK